MAIVLTAGRTTVDVIMKTDRLSAKPEKIHATDCHFTIGGPAANAAIAIARQGGTSYLLTRLGQDHLGSFISDILAAEGVDLSPSVMEPGAQSSISAALIDRDGERQTINHAGSGFHHDIEARALAMEPDAVLADNRYPDITRFALAEARRLGVPAVLDAEAPFDAAIAAAATHIAFSRQGLEDFAGSTDLLAGLARADSVFDGFVCVTDGAAGVWYLEGSEVCNIKAFEVNVVDTVAAGDVWHGVFTLGLAEGMAVAEAMRRANAAAALKCTAFGGITACPDSTACEKLMKENPS